MRTSKAAFAGLVGAAMLTAGIQGTAAAATTQGHAAAPAAAPMASLNCKTSVGHTGGWVECQGKGTWRVKSNCDNEPDKYTTWHSQRGGTQRIYAVQCTFKMNDVTYEVK